MTKRERVLAIAKDVLAHLRLLSCEEGSYIGVRSTEKASDAMDKLIEKGGDAQPHIDKIARNCDVCALGAAFLSYVRLYDGVSVEDVVPDALIEKMKTVFSAEQLMLIEAAFELDARPPIVGRLGGEHLPAGSRDAVCFGERFDDPKKRLKAIMENIVANDGVFKPKQALKVETKT